jgi:hypothetical protein
MNLKNLFRFSCCLFFLSIVWVESAPAGSLYSRYGIGLVRNRDNVRAIGMGGACLAINDSISFYFLNPAALTPVNLSRIQGAFRYERADIELQQSEGFLSQEAGVNNLGLAIPVKTGQVLTFGVRPYSAGDFQFTLNQNDTSYTESLQGVGGVSELYLGFAANIGGWHAGLMTDFYFGQIKRIWRLNYVTDDFRNSEDVINNHFTGIGLHLGLQKQIGSWKLGAAAGLPTRLEVKTELSARSGFTGVVSESKLKLPFWWGAGFGYAPSRHWLLSADYRTQRWSGVKPEELLGDRGVDSYDLSFGGEFIPSFDRLDGYLKRVSYRFGGAYRQLPYEEPAGKKVREWTVNLGLGLPFGQGYNRIDFAVEFGRRGSLTDNLSKENIVLLHAAIIGSERWFQRPRRK